MEREMRTSGFYSSKGIRRVANSKQAAIFWICFQTMLPACSALSRPSDQSPMLACLAVTQFDPNPFEFNLGSNPKTVRFLGRKPHSPNEHDQPPLTVPVVKLLFVVPLGQPLHFVEA